MHVTTQALVDAKLYPNQEAVIQDALRSLLHEKPHLRVELAVRSYQDQEISLARAAQLARLSFDHMREILVKRGIQVHLGSEDAAEARQEVEDMACILAGRRPQ